MQPKLKSKEEVFSLINKFFGKARSLQVEIAGEEIIISRGKGIVEKTKGTIKNLNLNTIKKIAKSEEFCGH